jgi:hypothetical protein
MSVVVLPGTIPTYDWIVRGYYPERDATQGNTNLWDRGALGLAERLQAQAIPKEPLGFNSGGSGVVESVGPYRGDFAARISRTTAAPIVNAYGGLNCMPVTDVTGLAAGYTNPSWRRVCWMTIRIAQDAGTLAETAGMLFLPFGAAQVADIWPTLGNSAGFGITADGAGAWQWSMFSTGAFPGNRIEGTPLPAVADPQDWNQFDIVVTSGAPGREAEIELFVNGVSTLTRVWVGAAPLAPDYAATQFTFHPVWRVGQITGDNMMRSSYTFRNGRFLPSGQEVLA